MAFEGEDELRIQAIEADVAALQIQAQALEAMLTSKADFNDREFYEQSKAALSE